MSDQEYTPLAEIRREWVQYQRELNDYGVREDADLAAEEAGDLFDNAIARHDAEVRAQALEDAAAEYGSGKLSGISTWGAAYTAAWLSDRAERIRKEVES